MYLALSKFFGKDSRRSELTSQPGVLLELRDAHINQGGEIEKRKGFIRTVDVDGCFGLQSTSAGLYTFGSDATPVGFSDYNIGTVGVPLYVNYQRLQHPAVLAGVTYDVTKHDMTAVAFSETFGGAAFVVATFSDGRSYCYYDGAISYDFIDGLVLPYMDTTVKVVTAMVATVNRTTVFDATQVTMATVALVRVSNVTTVTVASTANLTTGSKVTISGVTASSFNAADVVITVVNGTTFTYPNVASDDTATVQGTVLAANFIIEGQSGVDYTLNSTEDSTIGTISTPVVKQEEVEFRAGISAVASFKIMAGSSGAAATAATGTITRDGTNPSNNDYVIIGNKRYTFVTTLSGVEGQVKIGAAASDTLTNLKNAINHTGTPGTDYVSFQRHPYVTAGTISGSDLPLTASKGSSGNSVTLTESITPAWTVSAATMTGGAGNCIASIKSISPANVEVELITNAVVYGTDNADTASDVVQEINNNTSSGLAHGYTAEADGNRVVISSSTSANPMPSEYVLQVTVGGNVCVGDCMFYFTQLASAFTISMIRAAGIDLLPAPNFVYPQVGTIDTLAELYSSLETQINGKSGHTDIVARGSSNFIQVGKTVTRSDDQPLPVYVTFALANTGGVVFGPPPAPGTPVSAEIPTGFITAAVDVPVGAQFRTADVLNVVAAAGTPPYIYSWEPAATGTDKSLAFWGGSATTTATSPYFFAWKIDILNNGTPSALFAITFTNYLNLSVIPSGTYTGRFVCKVTDSLGNLVVSNECSVSIVLIK